MDWPSLEAFWHMGGHGLFVWGSYGATALVVALELWALRRRTRRARAALAEAAAAGGPR